MWRRETFSLLGLIPSDLFSFLLVHVPISQVSRVCFLFLLLSEDTKRTTCQDLLGIFDKRLWSLIIDVPVSPLCHALLLSLSIFKEGDTILIQDNVFHKVHNTSDFTLEFICVFDGKRNHK